MKNPEEKTTWHKFTFNKRTHKLFHSITKMFKCDWTMVIWVQKSNDTFNILEIYKTEKYMIIDY